MDSKLFELIKELDNEYSELRDRLCIKKADGDLARLANLREEFDDRLDGFFDNPIIRIQYGDFDNELSNAELLAMMDDEDTMEYIDFYKDYLTEIKAELSDRPQVFFDTYINLINEADNTIELDKIVSNYLTEIGEDGTSETYEEIADRLDDDVMKAAVTKWHEIEK